MNKHMSEISFLEKTINFINDHREMVSGGCMIATFQFVIINIIGNQKNEGSDQEFEELLEEVFGEATSIEMKKKAWEFRRSRK